MSVAETDFGKNSFHKFPFFRFFSQNSLNIYLYTVYKHMIFWCPLAVDSGCSEMDFGIKSFQTFPFRSFWMETIAFPIKIHYLGWPNSCIPLYKHMIFRRLFLLAVDSVAKTDFCMESFQKLPISRFYTENITFPPKIRLSGVA